MRMDESELTLAEASGLLVPWPPRPRMPRAGLRVWLKTARPVRAVLPTRLVVARAQRKGRRLWDEAPAEHAHALRTMEAVVCGTPQERELAAHARQHLIEEQAWEALFWQSWTAPRIDAASGERLVRLCSGDRGVVLSACHLGPYFRKSKRLVRLGLTPYVVAGEWFLAEPTPDYWGRRLARWRRGLPEVPLVRARGSYAVLRTVLAAGRTALVYFDMPGSHETEFLGKRVMLVDGTARLAAETDALVVPVRSVRDGHVIRLEVFDALDPRDFQGADDLHVALAGVHERLILERPAAMADPASFGWEGFATASCWLRPPREHSQRASDSVAS
jgi:lauroyl/myristoyl acyltransferase